jgi:hypothetical protein
LDSDARVHDTIPCATHCAVRTAEEAVVQNVAVVVVAALGGPPLVEAQQAHHDADDRC